MSWCSWAKSPSTFWSALRLSQGIHVLNRTSSIFNILESKQEANPKWWPNHSVQIVASFQIRKIASFEVKLMNHMNQGRAWQLLGISSHQVPWLVVLWLWSAWFKNGQPSHHMIDSIKPVKKNGHQELGQSIWIGFSQLCPKTPGTTTPTQQNVRLATEFANANSLLFVIQNRLFLALHRTNRRWHSKNIPKPASSGLLPSCAEKAKIHLHGFKYCPSLVFQCYQLWDMPHHAAAWVFQPTRNAILKAKLYDPDGLHQCCVSIFQGFTVTVLTQGLMAIHSSTHNFNGSKNGRMEWVSEQWLHEFII